MPAAPAPSPAERAALDAIARLVKELAGLDPPAWVLEARARDAAKRAAIDLPSLAARLADRAALSSLVEALRVGETRFFRHRAQVAALARRVIPERARAGGTLRAWSAGCASGEEAWTLAILLAEAGGAFEVLGTNLSSPAIEAARRADYPAAELDEVPPASRARWFVPAGGDRLAVAETLRGRVRFEVRNLLEPIYPRALDLVLCRNVLIYFDAAARDAVIGRLAESLLPGGYLFLGYSETLRSHDQLFEPLRDDEGVIYRRRGGPQRALEPPPRRRTSTAVGTPPPPPRLAPPSPPAVLRLTGSYDEESLERLARELRPLIEGAARVVDLDGADFLDEQAARLLLRAAESAPGPLRLRATRPALRRFVETHRLCEGGRFQLEWEPA